MRISDWSSDVCSSDLDLQAAVGPAVDAVGLGGEAEGAARRVELQHAPDLHEALGDRAPTQPLLGDEPPGDAQKARPPEGEGAGLGLDRPDIGSASCR